jgi:DNA-binding NarL/FixJ family response regulator
MSVAAVSWRDGTHPRTASTPNQHVTDSVGGEVRALVDALVQQVAELRSGDQRADGIVLDIEIDGVRCLLTDVSAKPPPAPLTPRERQIVRMVADGCSSKSIAGRLNISSGTVATHLRRTFAKLGVRSRPAMVARAIEERLLDQRPS